MKLNLKIDVNKLTWDQMCAIEDGKLTSKMSRELIAEFMLDENGKEIPYDEAYKALGPLTVPQIKEAADRLKTAFQELQAQAVPPSTGDA